MKVKQIEEDEIWMWNNLPINAKYNNIRYESMPTSGKYIKCGVYGIEGEGDEVVISDKETG